MTCAVCVAELAMPTTGRKPSYCAPPSPCKTTAKRWKGWQGEASRLRERAATSENSEEIRELLAHASGLDEAVAWQREAARDGWAAASAYVDELNAAVNAITDDD